MIGEHRSLAAGEGCDIQAAMVRTMRPRWGLVVGLCALNAIGCGSDGAGSGTGGLGGSAGAGGEGGAAGGEGGTGGQVPALSCAGLAAAATETCLSQVNAAWQSCYSDAGGPCDEDDDTIESALASLSTSVAEGCEDREFGDLSVDALVERLQVACSSEALSLASRSYGGPQGAAWEAGSSEDQSCLELAHQRSSELIGAILTELNVCLEAENCNGDALDESVTALQETAASEISSACPDLGALIALTPNQYLDRARHQADCVVATSHPDTAGVELSCGPTRVAEMPARGEYVQIILDEDEWGTRCGDGSPFAFQLRLAPEGERLDRVIVGMQGGGVCVFEDDCARVLANSPGLFESLSDEPPRGGIMSDDAESNPFANWTKVYLPYCNQDVFAGGGRVQEFTDFTVARYGAVNVRAAMEYVRNLIWGLIDQESDAGYRPDEVVSMFGGWSAGGFGTLYNYHWMLDDLQWPQTTGFPDAALSLDSGGLLSVATLGTFAISAWDTQAYLPPYCFDGGCAVGPVLYEATAPRLKAVPNQQLLVLTNQNDAVQVGTTFFPSTPSWINAARESVCETRELNGIHYYLTSITDSVHVVSLSNELYQGSVAGAVMSEWLFEGAVSDPDSVITRMEEGDFVTAVPGVSPFPCTVEP